MNPIHIQPNVVVECLTPLFHIPEVPALNLGPETGYPNRDFSWISSVPPVKYRDSTLNLGHDSLLPNPFQLITYHPFIQRYRPSY
jgi:hypothetical protein